MTMLLVMFLLQGEVYSFAVPTRSLAECLVAESSAATWLPRVIEAKPEAFAVKCAELQPFLTAS